MRFPLALLFLGAGALALAWGAHDLAQVLLQTQDCTIGFDLSACPPGTERAAGIAMAGAVAILIATLLGHSARIRVLIFGVVATSVSASVVWSQFGPSAQPEDPSLGAVGIAAVVGLVGLIRIVAANGTAVPTPMTSGDGDGGGFWSFDSSDSGGDSGCGGGCGGGD